MAQLFNPALYQPSELPEIGMVPQAIRDSNGDIVGHQPYIFAVEDQKRSEKLDAGVIRDQYNARERRRNSERRYVTMRETREEKRSEAYTKRVFANTQERSGMTDAARATRKVADDIEAL